MKFGISIKHETKVLTEKEIYILLTPLNAKIKFLDVIKLIKVKLFVFYMHCSEWKIIISINNIDYKFSLNGIERIDYSKKIIELEKTHTDYSWNIEPTDRSWIIAQDGVIRGGINHRTILKRFFTKEWDELKKDNKDDSEIEMILEGRLINLHMIYVGELTDLYVITLRLDRSERNLIQCFVKSFLLSHKDFKERNISIQIYKGKTKKYKIHQIITDGDACLCELAKTLPPYNKVG